MTLSNPYRSAHYTTSATKLSNLPIDEGAEVAFAGRSNAGKSSAINTVTEQKSLARTSKTPGRTQMINFFEINSHQRLVDLPGYGYAKVPEKMKIQWQNTLGQYLSTRKALIGLILIMDCRHPLKPFDIQMAKWANQATLPLHILLTKADKLRRGAAITTLKQVDKDLEQHHIKATSQLFSSHNQQGKIDTVSQLNQWFNTSL